MADYEINAEIKADSKGFTNGIEKAQKSTKSFSSSLTKTLKSVTGLYLGLAGATKVVKDTIKYINESTEAYKAEALSLKALETAVNNNPFTNGESIQGLKDFASEIQRTTNYGDDYLFPFMQQLISSGRTQAETMKIIKVATDIASSGAMSFETAIQQLNATMNGNIGRLGQQNAELKSLTEEELRNGKAVEILGEKYKGLAEATVDSRKQLENAKGDLKEAIGQLTAPTADKWNKFWQSFYEKGINTINRLDARKIAQPLTKAIEKAFRDSFTTSKAIGVLGSMAYSQISENDMAVGYATIAKRIRDLTDAELEAVKVWIEGLKEVNDAQKTILEVASEELNRREEINKRREEESEKANALAKAEADRLAQEERDAEKVAKAKEELLEQEKRNREKIHEVEVENARALAELRRKELEEEEKIAKEKAETIKTLYTNSLNATSRVISGIMKGIATGVQEAVNIVKSAINYIQKIVEFNFDDFIDNLLKFEDKLLTFVVGMKNQIPKVFETIFSSIAKILTNIDEYITVDDISEMVYNLLMAIVDNLPTIIKNISSIINKLLNGLIKGITDWVKNGGWKKLLQALLDLQKNLENTAREILPQIAQAIVDMLPDLVNFIKESIISASNTLADLIPSIIEIIISLIKAILEVITDTDIMESSGGVISSLITAIIEQIIPAIIEIFLDFIDGKYKTNLLSLGGTLFTAILDGFKNADWGAIFDRIIAKFKELGENIKTLFTSIWDELSDDDTEWYEVVGAVFTGGLSLLPKLFASGTNNAPSGLSIVGEQGPELIDLHGGERIYTAQNTKAILSGASGNSGNTMNVTFNNLKDTTASAMMSQLRYYNRQLAVNGF